MHRLPGCLADDVPQRHLDPRQRLVGEAAHVVPLADPVDPVQEALDIERAVADDASSHLVDDGGNGFGGAVPAALPDAGDPCIGLDAHEHTVDTFAYALAVVIELPVGNGQNGCGDLGDLHRESSQLPSFVSGVIQSSLPRDPMRHAVALQPPMKSVDVDV